MVVVVRLHVIRLKVVAPKILVRNVGCDEEESNFTNIWMTKVTNFKLGKKEMDAFHFKTKI
jgi:hypothetical protein